MSSLVRIEEDILSLEQTIRSLRTDAPGCSTSSGEGASIDHRHSMPELPGLRCIPETDSEGEYTGSRL